MGDSVKSASTTSSSSRSRLAQARLKKLKAQRQLRRIDELIELEQAERDILRRKQMFSQKAEIQDAEDEEKIWSEVLDDDDSGKHHTLSGDVLPPEHTLTSGRDGDLADAASTGSRTFLADQTSGRDGDLANAASRGSRTFLVDQTSGRDGDLADAASKCSRTFLADQTSGRDGDLADAASRGSKTFLADQTSFRHGDLADAASRGRMTFLVDWRSAFADKTSSGSGEPEPGFTRSICSASNIDIVFERLVNTLNGGLNLPKPELFTSIGKVTDYCKFIKNFETNIATKVSDTRMREVI
ncbi:hypothetical protein DPMN_133935 [Dreissena polymorpha]|uniref:Uncharacterized protein n=1 Tax=Dreissena polymorpha TaxID=45954 RepID=A0A9D4FV87_DREPO|nr:hypothetical protein DPMN_133935 [Dreissena polymorpha]